MTARLPGMSRDILAAPWRLGDSPGSRGAFADLGDGTRVMAVFAKTHELAVHVTELHNDALAAREALLEAAGVEAIARRPAAASLSLTDATRGDTAMPDGRVSIQFEGTPTVFDPDSPRAFAEAAGSQFVRLEGRAAVIRTEGGAEMPVYPGWAVIRPDGSGDGKARFVTPEVLAAGLAREG